jgi:putative heme-binding domain-containing protein
VDLRVEAAHALLPVTQEISIPIVRKLLKSAQPQQIANELSSSKPGAGLLCELFQDKAIPLEAFDLSAAERIHQSYPDNPSAKAILANAHKRLAERRSQAQARIHQLQAYISKNPGDPSKGQATFASCLTCHRVGDTGQDIAPPLDGSGHRELEHLLTAIVDPDAAIEGNYGLYRITKTDGSVVEGYLDKKEALGTTIAVMGGSRIFVPMAEIQKASFVGGRSFMPPAFGQLPQETMADLVAYIATLKTGK